MARHHCIAMLCAQLVLCGASELCHRAHAQSRSEEAEPVTWHPSVLPGVRLALGPGWSVPSPPAAMPAITTDLFLTLAVGERINASKGSFFFQPELAYSFRSAALGFDHQFNMGLGLGLAPSTNAVITYTPYFVAGRQNVMHGDLLHNERALGFRHALRFETLYEIVFAELSHQVVVLEYGSRPQHDLRLMFGIDLCQLALGIALRAIFSR